MSKMGNWILDLEEDAALMSREEFIRTNGAVNVDVWDRVNGPPLSQLDDPEVDDVGC